MVDSPGSGTRHIIRIVAARRGRDDPDKQFEDSDAFGVEIVDYH
jgi:hypothetical protein